MAHLQPTQLKIPAAVGPFSGSTAAASTRGGANTNIVTMRVADSRNWSRTLCERATSTAPPTDHESVSALEKHGDKTAADEEFPPFEVDIKKRTAADDQGVEYFVEEYGWKVRRMVEGVGEERKVARIQAEAFHEPVAIFNDWFFYVFQAEVLSGLLYRLRNSPPNRYACLVAEPTTDVESQQDRDGDGNKTGLVGAVDVTVLRDSDVLQHLDGANQYLYVSGIAVSRHHRRKKVATALLKACEAISIVWGYDYLVLRAYEDDWGARALYSNAGYTVVSRDPPWVAWIGRKRRILMTKRSSSSSADDDNSRFALPIPPADC